MNASIASAQDRIQRCAVCKIDRKGRFILADHEAEKLFGLSEVKLFGQPFVDFLDPADRDILQQMASDRNPYETIYDSARLTIINANNQRIPALVVLTVNFGGGNPANYQIVVVREDEAPAVSREPETSDVWFDFLGFLDNDDEFDLAELAERCRSLTGVTAVSVYAVGPEDNDMLAQAGSQAALSTQEQSSDDRVCASIGLPDGRPGEVCFRVGEDQVVRRSAEVAAGLLHLFRPPVGSEVDSSPEPRRLVALLDSLGAAACLIDPRGQTLTYNQSFAAEINTTEPLTSPQALWLHLDQTGFGASVEPLRAHIEVQSRGKSHFDYAGSLVAGDGDCRPVRLLPITTDTLNEAWLMLLNGGVSLLTREKLSDSFEKDLLRPALKQIVRSVEAGDGSARGLKHSGGSDLTAESRQHLECLRHHLGQASSAARTVITTLDLCGADEKPSSVKLQLLLDEALARIQARYPGAEFDLSAKELPETTADRVRLQAVIESILVWIASTSGDQATKVDVRANESDESLLIEFEVPSIHVSRQEQRRLYECGQTDREQAESGDQPPICGNLALVQQVLIAMDGQFEIESGPDSGTRIRVGLPRT